MQKLHAAVPKGAGGAADPAEEAVWKFPLALAIGAAQAPLRARFQAASKAAAIARTAGYKQWIQKALANGMGGPPGMRNPSNLPI